MLEVRQNRNDFFKPTFFSKKQTNEFNFTTKRLVSVRFLEEIEYTKKRFRNKLTFKGQ